MEKRILGRTGLSVSVMGLGSGGHSRLGMSQNKGEENAIAIVRRAIDLGVNFIDTAEQYGTEAVIGKAIAGFIERDQVVLSTKVAPRLTSDVLRTAREMRTAVEDGLRRLQTEYVDVLHLHAVRPDEYVYCAAELVPTLTSLREEGKIRFLGITEGFASDTGHDMLANYALRDDIWDVVMVGFNVLNQSARERVLSVTQARQVGVLDMFAVRRVLGNAAALRDLVHDLVAKGLVRGDAFDTGNPLGFLLTNGIAETVPDAAYRFCRDEPGIDVVLSGTGSIAHLEANAASLGRPPLPAEVTERLRKLFDGVDSVSGN